MMHTVSTTPDPVDVIIGIAAESGAGLAYASWRAADRMKTLRVPFQYEPAVGLDGRDGTYAALTAVSARLLDAGLASVRLTIADGRLGADLAERGRLPAALTLPYVSLRCRLNRFRSHAIAGVDAGTREEARLRDLTARARAEVTLHVAA